MSDPFIDVQFSPGTVITSPWLNGINDSVKNLLANVNTQSLRVVSSVAAMQALDITQFTDAITTGYYSNASGGNGVYYYDASDTTTPANGGTVITSNTGTGRWKLAQDSFASVMQFGAKGDGVTDDSVAIQACIDALKGHLIIIDAGHSFLCAGIQLNGSTYNFTTVRFDGGLKMKPDGGNSNFGGGWVGFLIKDCSGVTANPKVDGNRINMTAREQIFNVGVAGAALLNLPSVEVTEMRGDGLYISQSNWQANSTNPNGIKIGRVSAINSSDDGRNAISIIAGLNIDIEYVYSNSVGGVINSIVEPGGIDIEPDFGYQTCSNIWIGRADIISSGNSGIGIFGKSISGNDANRDWNCFNITIDNFNLLKTGTSGSAITATPWLRCADVKIKGNISYNSVRGEGLTIDFAQRFQADLTISNVTVGVFLGRSNTLTDFDVKAAVTNYQGAAIRPCSVVRGRVTGRVWASAGGGSPFAVQCHNEGRGTITQQDVVYTVDAPYDGQVLRAFRNEPGNQVSYGTGCIAQNADWSGYANQGATNDATIRTVNNLGWNNATAVPSSGSWFFGDFVRNDAAAQSAGKINIGWVRLNTGSNNVLNTDWSGVFATIS